MNANITALLAAADAVDGVAGPVFNYEDRDKYGRAVDVLDALGLIVYIRVNDAGDEPFEVAKLTDDGLLVGPFGFTPNGDRPKPPTEKLAEKELDDPEVTRLLERHARVMASGGAAHDSLTYAQRIKIGVALGRLLRQRGHAPLSEPLTDDEAGRDSVVVPLNTTRLHVVTQPEREGA